MHPALSAIASELDQLATQISATVPAGQPFGIAHGNWSFPISTSEELRERVEEIARAVRLQGKDALDASTEARLNDYPRRLSFLRSSTVPNIWGNGQVGVSTLNDSLDSLERSLRPALHVDAADDAKTRLEKLRLQVRGLEAKLAQLQPRTLGLEDMVRAVEETYNAALELPSSLEDVRDAKASITKTAADIALSLSKVEGHAGSAEGLLKRLESYSKQGKEYLDGCERAYTAGVAKGLAAAFLERSDRLNKSMWLWVAGLLLSLVAGVYWGGQKIHELAAAAHSGSSTASTIALDAVMALISVAAPVWFAWLSTRQIGQTFRLSEDYAYKASVARSYEGYRKEAKSVSDELVEKLLSSAIRRVDEQPLRVVEHGSPGSPWHDLANSPLVSKAIDTVPEFASRVRELATEALKTPSRTATKPSRPAESQPE